MPDGSLRSRFRTLRAGRGIAVHCLLCCSLMLGYSPSAHAANIITFDPPGSVSTDATAINSLGAITGAYFDTNGVGHAFVRNPDGTFTTFNAPPDGGFDPFPSGISDLGSVTGSYEIPIPDSGGFSLSQGSVSRRIP